MFLHAPLEAQRPYRDRHRASASEGGGRLDALSRPGPDGFNPFGGLDVFVLLCLSLKKLYYKSRRVVT